MINKIIELLTKTSSKLKEFDNKYQTQVQKYANAQCRKVAVLCGSVGIILGFLIGKN